MDHSSDLDGFLAYAAGQVAGAEAALAAHIRTSTGLCACGRPWPCREVLWWRWVRSHYAPLLPPAPPTPADRPNLVRPYIDGARRPDSASPS